MMEPQAQAQAAEADLWSKAPLWRGTVIGAVCLTAAAIALPMMQAQPPGAPISPGVPIDTPRATTPPIATPPPVAIRPAPQPVQVQPKVVYAPVRVQPQPAAAPAEAQAAPAPAPAVAPAPAAETAACTLRAAPAPRALGAGVVTGFEDRAVSQARITLTERQSGGLIDPDYVDNLRVRVRMDDGHDLVFLAPKAMPVRVGDRVTAQGGYRNALLACNYIPPLITADLGATSEGDSRR